MGTEAEKLFAGAIDAVKRFFDHPAVKAHYEAEARRNRIKAEAEEKARRERIEAEEAERQCKRSYDVWALNGGGDECTQFGIHDGCKPWCPVFERGQCSIQPENEAIFAADPEFAETEEERADLLSAQTMARQLGLPEHAPTEE